MRLLTKLGVVAAVAALGLSAAHVGLADDDKTAENPNGKPLTTADKYQYVPAESLPPVKGVSNYKWDKKDPVVRFPINIWIGWAPIIVANHGLQPSKESVFYKKYGFQVDLQVIDDPGKARDAFASGETHVFWGTLDMMVLYGQELKKDSRTSLRIFQQIDWSNGGDGIVARNGIKTINDLKPGKDGKKKVITLAQYSPSHYYILSLLSYAGIGAEEVEFKFVGDAFQAAKAFVSEPTIDACVTWSPDIYNISDPKKSGIKDATLISSTKDAKRLIADVWAARADFAKDHPDVIEGLVHGIFDGMDLVKKDPDAAAKLVEEAYKLKPGEAKYMFGDAHQTNWAENFDFFFNGKNPCNFERTWDAIVDVYAKAHLVDKNNVPKFGEVMDPRVCQAIAGDFKHHKNEYGDVFKAPAANGEAPKAPAAKEILTRTVRIHFAPNVSKVDPSYDPGADKLIEEVGRMAAQFGGSTIVVQGHCDRSKFEEAKKLGDAYLKTHSDKVKKLSEDRAKGIVEAILEKYPDFKKDSDKFVSEGMGWDKPLADDALSRRVEIRVLSPE